MKKTTPYIEGQRAFERSEMLTENPYNQMTPKFVDWTAGWLTAKKKNRGTFRKKFSTPN